MLSCAAVLAGLVWMTDAAADPGRPLGWPGDPSRGALGALGQSRGPELPKVPFGHQPCQSLSPADQAALKMTGKIVGKADRAPATLPFDNMCTYLRGGGRYAQVGYQTKADYDMNGSGNRSTDRQAPGDLPGGFYDKQGGLWFAKNGYYVVVAGPRDLKEPVARAIAGKL